MMKSLRDKALQIVPKTTITSYKAPLTATFCTMSFLVGIIDVVPLIATSLPAWSTTLQNVKSTLYQNLFLSI